MKHTEFKNSATHPMRSDHSIRERLHSLGGRFISACCALAMGFAALIVGSGGGVVPAAYADPSDGSATTSTTATSDVKPPAHNKTIQANDDGTYTLRMSVTGSSSESQEWQVTPLNIALVLDVSGSMADPASYTPVSPQDVIASNTYYVRSGNAYIKVTYYRGYWLDKNYRPYDPNTTTFYQGTTRLEALKSSVNHFLEQIDNKNTEIRKVDPTGASDIQVTLIKYASDKSDSIGNGTYPSQSCGPNNECNYSQVVTKLTNQISGIEEEVKNLKPGGATQANFGLELAYSQLKEGKAARPNAQSMTIFHSDGAPTRAGSGDDFTPNVANSALQIACAIKSTNENANEACSIPNTAGTFTGIGSPIFSIDADPDETSRTTNFMKYVSSNYPNATNMNSPGAQENQNFYVKVSDTDTVTDVFDQLFQHITTGIAYQGISMTDTLSQYAQLIGCTEDHIAPCSAETKLVVTDAQGNEISDSMSVGLPDASGNTYRITSDKDTGSVSVRFPTDYKLKEGYTYTLEYGVEPTQHAYDEYAANFNKGLSGDALYSNMNGDLGTDYGSGATSAGKAGFRSNREATLTYSSRVAGAVNAPVTIDMPHPVLQVQANKLTVRKQWLGSDEHRPTSIKVDVECKLTDTDTDCSSGAVSDFEIKSDDWTGTIALPLSTENRTYTVTEDRVDNFHTGYDENHAWSITGSRLPADGHETTVTNYPTTAPIDLGSVDVGKTVANVDTPNGFSFRLSAREDQGITVADGQPFSAETTLGGPDDPYTQGVQKTGSFSDQTVNVPLPGAEVEDTASFGFTVREVNPNSSGSTAWEWDEDSVGVTISVQRDANGIPEFNPDGTVKTSVKYTYDTDDPDGTEANDHLAAFTNRLSPVTSLPLTGEGGVTQRTWLIVAGGLGGCVLMLAAGAALLRKHHDA